jgi:quercetin dioxygenase-like cupin family protein
MLVSDEENGGACQLYEVRLPPHRPGPPLHYRVDFIETFTVKRGKLDIFVDSDQKHLLLQPGENATAYVRQPHRFANDYDEPAIFTVKAKPAGGVVRAFQLAYGIANDGGAARDGLNNTDKCSDTGCALCHYEAMETANSRKETVKCSARAFSR